MINNKQNGTSTRIPLMPTTRIPLMPTTRIPLMPTTRIPLMPVSKMIGNSSQFFENFSKFKNTESSWKVLGFTKETNGK